MVLCTRFYTFVSYAKLNMKWKYIKSKAYVSGPNGKLIVSYLGGTRFITLLVPLCMQKNISRPIFYYIYKCLCNGHLSSHYMCAYCTFSIFPIPRNFHVVAENLHDNAYTHTTSVALQPLSFLVSLQDTIRNIQISYQFHNQEKYIFYTL